MGTPAEEPQVPITDAAIRDLAAKLGAPPYPFEPAAFRKGTITAIAASATPPTITVDIGGVAIPSIRFLDHYAPQVGHTVLLGKQGAEFLAIGHIADGTGGVGSSAGWNAASIGSGFTSGGNSLAAPQYRRVRRDGEWAVEWRGGVGRTTGATLMTVGADFRPSSRRACAAAGSSGSAWWEFETSGAVELHFASGSHSHSLSITDNSHTHTFSDSASHGHAGPSHAHSHGGAVASTSFGESVPSASVSVSGSTSGTAVTISGSTASAGPSDPSWASFDGVWYYL